MINKMKKIYILVILIILILPTILMPFSDNNKYEKRRLADFPSVIENANINTSFLDEFDEYFQDNFALKPYFTTYLSTIKYSVFNTSNNEKVILGKNGFLFFSNSIKDNIYKKNKASNIAAVLSYNLNLINSSIKENSPNTNFFFTIAPNKATIYNEYLYKNHRKLYNTNLLDFCDNYFSLNKIPYIDLRNSLLNSKEDNFIYYLKDTHWNHTGAKIAYSSIINTINPSKKLPLASYKEKNINQGIYDLSNMLFPTYNNQNIDKIPIFDSEYSYKSPIRSLEDLEIETINQSKNGSLLMFRDSFANTLLPYLSNSYNKVLYKRAIPYDLNLITKDKFDTVLIEIVERNLIELVNNAPILIPKTYKINDLEYKIDKNNNINITNHKSYISIQGLKKENEEYFISLNQNENAYSSFVLFNENEGYKFCVNLPISEFSKGNNTIIIYEKTSKKKFIYSIDTN